MADLAYIVVGFSVVLQGVLLFSKSEKNRIVTPIVNLVGVLLIGALLVERSLEIDFVALLGMFDSLLFFGMFVLILTVVYGFQKKLTVYPVVQFFSTIGALVFLLIASSPGIAKELLPPVPALQSNWLILHVAMSFIGEAFFVISFVTAILTLTSKKEDRKKDFERMTYLTIVIGYPIFTVGALIFGAIWAENAWGAYWSWDPKEIWALITWLVYSVPSILPRQGGGKLRIPRGLPGGFTIKRL